jgi:hypothetical protein
VSEPHDVPIAEPSPGIGRAVSARPSTCVGGGCPSARPATFLTGDLLSRAEARAGEQGLQPSHLTTVGASSPFGTRRVWSLLDFLTLEEMSSAARPAGARAAGSRAWSTEAETTRAR